MRKKPVWITGLYVASFLVACGGDGGNGGGNSDEGNNTPSDNQAPSLTLITEVINDNGGNAVRPDFDLNLQGNDGVHDAGVVYQDSGNGARQFDSVEDALGQARAEAVAGDRRIHAQRAVGGEDQRDGGRIHG